LGHQLHNRVYIVPVKSSVESFNHLLRRDIRSYFRHFCSLSFSLTNRIKESSYLSTVLTLMSIESVDDKVVQSIFRAIPGQSSNLAKCLRRDTCSQLHTFCAGFIILSEHFLNSHPPACFHLCVVKLR